MKGKLKLYNHPLILVAKVYIVVKQDITVAMNILYILISFLSSKIYFVKTKKHWCRFQCFLIACFIQKTVPIKLCSILSCSDRYYNVLLATFNSFKELNQIIFSPSCDVNFISTLQFKTSAIFSKSDTLKLFLFNF